MEEDAFAMGKAGKNKLKIPDLMIQDLYFHRSN